MIRLTLNLLNAAAIKDALGFLSPEFAANLL